MTTTDDIREGRKVVFTILADQADELRRLVKNSRKDCGVSPGACDYENLILVLAERLPPEPIKAGDRVRRDDVVDTGDNNYLVLAVYQSLAWVLDGRTPITINLKGWVLA